ncbi:unnamed protein product [Effrenium voratum]|nr:unnamed protein product [Effrenium voratum]
MRCSLDSSMVSRLLEFPQAVKTLERSLLNLEQSIHDLDAEMKPEDKAAAVSAPAQSAPASAARAASPSTSSAPEPRWRKDRRCGKNAPLPDGKPSECDPTGEFACCSAMGWCGGSKQHCNCKSCVNYREQYVTQLGHGVAALPPMPPRDGHKGRTVLLVIPFRDRESHLKLFKQYWRWFAEHGRNPKTVQRWVVYVSEQFDSQTFNRGWNFNTALAIASAQTTASADIKSEMGMDFDCAVIQDIDYLPEKGVDYGDCEVPMQLSAEIDRYNWKTPYLTSAGGIVGMSLRHWRKINGFGNNYFGWGGEDDELHHRLRLNGLLYGDCYPYCSKNDGNVGKPGQSIKRPKKGFGRFSGKFMHSANHTKRITDSRAYSRNLEQLKEIGSGGNRWKTDGLNSLAFSIVDSQEDAADEEKYGITYRHIKVRRGKKPFHVRDVPMAIPPGFCKSTVPDGWILKKLGDGPIPWDLEGLRQRAAAFVGAECPGASKANFLLVDRRQQVAKIFDKSMERMLVVYLRSLGSAMEDALIVADPRPGPEILKAFQDTHAFRDPPTFYCVCTSKLKKGGPKYSVHQGDHCSGGGWDAVPGGLWRGYANPKPGTKAVTWCDNEKHWTQVLVKGTSCPETWSGLKWIVGGTFYVKEGTSFCAGTRKVDSEEMSFSRLLAKKSCSGDGFTHELNFDPVAEPEPVASLGICIGQDASRQKSRISMQDDCDSGEFTHVARFAARRAKFALQSDRLFCVPNAAGDVIRAEGRCTGTEGFDFALPVDHEHPVSEIHPDLAKELRLCVGFREGKDKPSIGVDQQCDSLQRLSVDFQAPSLLDVAASMPSAHAKTAPLFTIVEEEGFGAGNPVKGKKKKYVDHSVEELDVVFGIGNGPQGCSVREGIVLAGDVEEFQVLRLTEWPTVILGADVLIRDRLALSFRQNRMYLPSGSAAEGVIDV